MSESPSNYPGDAAWANFVKAITPFWTPCENKAELIQLFNGAEDLAIAAYYVAGRHTEEWAKSPVPALRMRKPVLFLSSASGIKTLRAMLMRAP